MAIASRTLNILIMTTNELPAARARACKIAQQTATSILSDAVRTFQMAPNSDTRHIVDRAMAARIAAEDVFHAAEHASDDAFEAEVQIAAGIAESAARALRTWKAE